MNNNIIIIFESSYIIIIAILNKWRIYLGPHTFRDAFAIISHLNGVDVYQIMKSLGHEQLSTSEIY
ncbi:tyrosine-type recombinase/integrase [Peribacillus simplex]